MPVRPLYETEFWVARVPSPDTFDTSSGVPDANTTFPDASLMLNPRESILSAVIEFVAILSPAMVPFTSRFPSMVTPGDSHAPPQNFVAENDGPLRVTVSPTRRCADEALDVCVVPLIML